jgi:hypothetical protein
MMPIFSRTVGAVVFMGALVLIVLDPIVPESLRGYATIHASYGFFIALGLGLVVPE